jgi:hypothetical protein
LRRAMEQRRVDLEEDHTAWDENDDEWSDWTTCEPPKRLIDALCHPAPTHVP